MRKEPYFNRDCDASARQFWGQIPVRTLLLRVKRVRVVRSLRQVEELSKKNHLYFASQVLAESQNRLDLSRNSPLSSPHGDQRNRVLDRRKGFKVYSPRPQPEATLLSGPDQRKRKEDQSLRLLSGHLVLWKCLLLE